MFYPVPAQPRFRRGADGRPVFQLIKYRGGDASTAPKLPATQTDGKQDAVTANAVPTVDGEVAGGLLIFDTEYTIGEEAAKVIRETLDQQVRSRFQREGRTVPEGFQIVLRSPTWTDGDVRLLMEDTGQGLYTLVSKSGKPSLMGNNVASFAAVLQSWQASLLEQAIRSGDFAPVQVNYNLKYLAKLPPVSIRIYAAADDIYSMYKDYGREINGGGVCSDPDTVVSRISEHVYSRASSRSASTAAVSPSTTNRSSRCRRWRSACSRTGSSRSSTSRRRSVRPRSSSTTSSCGASASPTSET